MGKFNLGATTLSTLGHETQGSSDDLGTLIKQLIAAAQPLEKVFEGSGKTQFVNFKNRADQITADLNTALGAIMTGQSGMDTAFNTGDTEMADNSRSAEGTANFDGAKFSGRA